MARFTRATFHQLRDGPRKAGQDGTEDDSSDVDRRCGKIGAGDGTRTHDILLGKQMFYH